MSEDKKENEEEGKVKIAELMTGLILAIFAAALAITDLGAGKYGDDELIAHNEKSNAYQWYSSKSIKQNLAEGQRDILQGLITSGVIPPEKAKGVEAAMQKLNQNIEKYGKEKKEILLGSAKVGKENWIQDVDGKLGQVIGSREWETKAEALGNVGDIFDLATLFLQLCLVLGAISLIMKSEKIKWLFFSAMVILGLAGSFFSVKAFLAAMPL